MSRCPLPQSLSPPPLPRCGSSPAPPPTSCRTPYYILPACSRCSMAFPDLPPAGKADRPSACRAQQGRSRSPRRPCPPRRRVQTPRWCFCPATPRPERSPSGWQCRKPACPGRSGSSSRCPPAFSCRSPRRLSGSLPSHLRHPGCRRGLCRRRSTGRSGDTSRSGLLPPAASAGADGCSGPGNSGPKS